MHQPPVNYSTMRFKRPSFPAARGKSGIHLQLRSTSFAKEVTQLPADFMKLTTILIELARQRRKNAYDITITWHRLRLTHERYWESFRFESEQAYLAYCGLPEGVTLRRWKEMVELFDKPTFLALGEEGLEFMMRAVRAHQRDPNREKRDYETIFKSYSAGRIAVDLLSFCDEVQTYVARKYESKAVQSATSVVPIEATPIRLGNGRAKLQVAAKVDEQFGVCPRCGISQRAIFELMDYVEVLEGIIARELGATKMPRRPQGVKNLFEPQVSPKSS